MNEQEMRESAVESIDGAIKTFLAGLKTKDGKLGVTDVLRLLDLRKELAKDEVREVKVTWVESESDLFLTNI